MREARASHLFSASRLTLRFGDAELEHAFRVEHWRQTMGGRRVGLLLGALMYAAFGLLDTSIIPDVAQTAWLIRFGVVCPALLASLALTFHPRLSRRTTLFGGGVGVLAGLGMIAMMLASTAPGRTLYYAGQLLVCMALYTFLQLRFVPAASLAWSLVLVYEVTALVHGTEPIILVTQTFFLVSTNAIGMLACYSMERVLRRAYLDQRTIAELAQLDPLTGLHNRRAFFSLGETEISRCAHERLPVSAAMVDIDYFKQINDQHGHTTGDRVLQMFGETLRAALRSGDVVCRYGGEEFLILMPATGEVEAERVAQRLHASLARLVVSAPGGPIRPTASIGVATLAAARADRLEQLISAADAALYAAKRAGRNRIMAA